MKLVNEILDHELEYQMLNDNIIIAQYITKHTGMALYYNVSSGCIKSMKIDFRDTHKYETDTFKLMRFDEKYWKAAKEIALCYMKHNRLGYGLYTEAGIVVG